MHPELSPIVAQTRFDGLAASRPSHHQVRAARRSGFLSRRRGGKHPPGTAMAPLVLLPAARERSEPAGDRRRVA